MQTRPAPRSAAADLQNSKGEIIIFRLYRDDVSMTAANTFRLSVIAAKEAGSAAPVRLIDGNTFLYIRHKDMFFVGVTRANTNAGAFAGLILLLLPAAFLRSASAPHTQRPRARALPLHPSAPHPASLPPPPAHPLRPAAMSFHFLYTMVDIFKGYFEEDFDEDSLRDNFTLVYELLDEMLDFGYPQNCALDVLKMYINLGSLRAPTSAAADKQMTSTITGARDWRRDGISYKKNEVYLDVDESVNLLVSASGAVLKNDVSAKILMKALLSGMPECKLGLNDKVVMEKDSSGKGKKAAGVDIDDCTFHRCVQLGKFDSDRTITFVPPDGEFELMRYRITENVNLPFRIIPSIEEHGATKVVLNIKAIANFSSQLFATNVAIKIPVRACSSHFFFPPFASTPRYSAAGSAPPSLPTLSPPPPHTPHLPHLRRCRPTLRRRASMWRRGARGMSRSTMPLCGASGASLAGRR